MLFFLKLFVSVSVSVLALDEFNILQQKYELESKCRFEAEKYAAEVSEGRHSYDECKQVAMVSP